MGLMPSMSPNVFQRRWRWLRCGKYVVITHAPHRACVDDEHDEQQPRMIAAPGAVAQDTKKSNDESYVNGRIPTGG